MSTKHFKIFFSFILAVILTFGLTISFQSLLADAVAPVANPPTCLTGNPGCDAPLNIGPLLQTKSGGLWINTNASSPLGLIVENGKVGLRKMNPDAQLQINPVASTEGLRIVTSDYSPVNIRNAADNADIFRVDQNGSLAVGSVPWARLTSFPSSATCTSGQFVTTIGAAIACAAPTAFTDVDTLQIVTSRSNGASTDKSITLSGSNLYLTQTANSSFYIDSNRGVQIRLDADNNTADEFAVNNGANTKVFSVDESGIVQVGNVPWARLSGFPSACAGGQFVTTVGASLTCAAPAAFTDVDTLQSVTTRGATTDRAITVAGLIVSGSSINISGSGDTTYNIHGWQAIGSYDGWDANRLYINGYSNFSSGTTVAGAGGLHVDNNLSVGGNITSNSKNVCLQDGTNCPAVAAEGDGIVGNEVLNAANATLARSGAGTAASPYTLALNLGNANTWSAAQTFSSLNTSGASYLNLATNIIKAQGTAAEVAINYGGSAKGFTVYDNTTSLFRVDSAGDVSVAQKLTVTGNITVAGQNVCRQDGTNCKDTSASDLVLTGSNSWILHTPDDGRTTMYFAPFTGGNWDWAHQINFSNQGNISAAGMIETKSGGIKFPDASVQTTAYAGGSQIINAANVSSGAFGSNSGGGDYTFPRDLGVGRDLAVVRDLTVGGKFNVAGADVAEEFGTTENLDFGTVVVMRADGVKTAEPCRVKYDKKVIGVVSDNPSIIMGKIPDKNKAVIALIGVVKIKVTTQNGNIKKGDLLVTSDLLGHAMKATEEKAGAIIGKALENFSGQTGQITALINLQ